jgi:capsular exopolysaccharide synthesis family protein
MTGTNPLERYLVLLRRWWPIIAGAVLLGLGAAWVTLPSPPDQGVAPEEVIEPGVEYRATHILTRGRETSVTENFDLVAMIAQQDTIVDAVSKELSDQVEPASVAAVDVTADSKLDTLAVTAMEPTAERARLLASTYAQEITRHFDERARTNHEEQVERARERLGTTDERIQELLKVQASEPEESLQWRLTESELSVLVDQYGRIQGEIRELSSSPASGATFETIHEPDPIPVAREGMTSFEMPDTPWMRLVLAALLAAAAGVAIVFGLDRIDTRIRSREDAEEAFGLPVIACVPTRDRRVQAQHPLAVRAEPGSEAAEAFRSLRLSFQLAPRWRLDRTAPTSNGTVGSAEAVRGGDEPKVLLVTSATTGEGKSTVAANLAVAIAESGSQVLVVDCDFRRSTVTQLLGLQPGPGLRDQVASEVTGLAGLVSPSAVENVDVIRSGRPGLAPSWFTSDAANLVSEASKLADVVIFDTGPLLVTNEAAVLMPSMDAVLVVARSGKTSWSSARQTTEQLTRLRATVAGVTLVGTNSTGTYGYYQALRRSVKREDALQ